MSSSICEVCGETRFEGWDDCPACKHPYPPAPDDRDVETGDEDELKDKTLASNEHLVLPASSAPDALPNTHI